MIWFCLGVVALLVLLGVQRWRSMGPLFADGQLAEVAAALPEMKRLALAGEGGEPASLKTATLAVAYSIAREGPEWVHHVSFSNTITPARAAGAFYLGLVRGLLRLEAYPLKAFVSQNQVFHLVVRLSDEEQQAFAALAVEPGTAESQRTTAIEGRAVILPRLGETAVPLPEHRG